MTTDPPVHSFERLTTPAGELVNIDAEMVPVIRRLWALGFATTACCQNVGEATAALRAQLDTSPGYGGDGFIAFHRGYALLKMPRDDARRLVTLLARTPAFRERVCQRWRAETWRMNVPLVCDGDTADIGPAALLHFPRAQITELAAALDPHARNATPNCGSATTSMRGQSLGS
jgi:hypothetical protein